MVSPYRSPGVYRKEVVLAPPRDLRTGVPAFLGFAGAGPVASPALARRWPEIINLLRNEQTIPDTLRTEVRLNLWPGFEQQLRRDRWPSFEAALRLEHWSSFASKFGRPLASGYLAHAVRGFFVNGGSLCYVLRLTDGISFEKALALALATLDELEVDLVCAPDLVSATGDVEALEKLVLAHCDTRGDRFAILDTAKGATVAQALAQRAELASPNGALYYPWIAPRPEPAADLPPADFIPPCGHVAGIYARTDERFGPHKAPANEVLEGVLDLERDLTREEQAELNPQSVNALRAFPGRGIRVWGARTLSRDAAWTSVSVRRIFLTAARWLELHTADEVFEPHTPALWARVRLSLNRYFSGLFRRGALRGQTEEEAFYVKCDAETNPPALRNAGTLRVELGLAPALPNEFVVVHITRHPGGVSITGPTPG